MPRKASIGPKRAVIRIDVVVANLLTYPEMREKMEQALADPGSGLSKYLTEHFNWRAAPKTNPGRTSTVRGFDVRVSSPPSGTPWGDIPMEQLIDEQKDT